MKKDKKKKREKRLQKERNVRKNRPSHKSFPKVRRGNTIRIIPVEESVMEHIARKE